MTAALTTPPAQPALALQIREVHALVQHDLERVNARLRLELNSDVPLIGQIGDYLIAAGGKRLRPILTILSARVLGCRHEDCIALATIIELIHTATLLHDDVVDESSQRRSRKTANALWGNAASVLVGDFLYSRAFQMMVGLKRMRVMEILADTTNAIAEGEVLQLINRHDPDVTEARYLEVIKRKTAVLFEAACRLGAVVADADAANEQRIAEFGLQLGFAFQIADDVLDYTGDAAVIGKNLGDDLAEGKATLPLIYAQARAVPEDAQIIRIALQEGRRDLLPRLSELIRHSDALDATMEVAERYATAARENLNEFAPSPELAALRTLTEYAVRRIY